MKKIFYLIALFCVYSCNAPQPDDVISIPIGANLFVTEGPNAGKAVERAGITNWNNPNDVYSFFIRTPTKGKLNLFLRHTNNEKSTISLKYGKKKFNVKLDAGENNISYMGTINIKDTGYIKLDFQGIEKTSDTYAIAYEILINGSASEGALSFANDFYFYFGRRGPSVHLNYLLSEKDTIEWFYNELTVPEGEDPAGAYYMANGFEDGYFGIQVNSPSERRVLFSVWNHVSEDNPFSFSENAKVTVLDKGENIITSDFGNDGSGKQSYMIYPWKTGHTYKFLTQVVPNGDGSTIYTSYFCENDKWIFIASFLKPNTNTYYKQAHSFLENFIPDNGYLSRTGIYSNQWACTKEGKWIELTEAIITANEIAKQRIRIDYKGEAKGEKFFLQNGAFFNDYSPIGTKIKRTATGKIPDINFNNLKN